MPEVWCKMLSDFRWKFCPLFSSKIILKSFKIWKSYCQKFGGFLFWNTVYMYNEVTYLWVQKSPCHEWRAKRRQSRVESRTLRRLAAQTPTLWWTACRPGWHVGSKDSTPVHTTRMRNVLVYTRTLTTQRLKPNGCFSHVARQNPPYTVLKPGHKTPRTKSGQNPPWRNAPLRISS